MAHSTTESQSSTKRFERGVRTAADSVEEFIDGGADMAKRAVGSAADKVSSVGSRVAGTSSDMVSDLEKAAQQAYDRVIKEGKRKTAQLEKDIKRSPLAAVGIAFVGGVILAKLMKR